MAKFHLSKVDAEKRFNKIKPLIDVAIEKRSKVLEQGKYKVWNATAKKHVYIDYDPHYVQNCVPSGTCICDVGEYCVSVIVCRLPVNCACSCPSPSDPHSHLVSNNCVVGMTGCACESHTCYGTNCVCSCGSTTCGYDCDDNYYWDGEHCVACLTAQFGDEDFSTYNEVDVPADHVRVVCSSKNVCAHKAYRNEDTYLWKDRGSNRFGDFEHLIDVRSDFAQDFCDGWADVLSDDLVDDVKGIYDAHKIAIGVELYRNGATYYIYLNELCPISPYYYSSIWNGAQINTWYYLKIIKSGTSLTCKIYPTKNDRTNDTNILATLSLVLHGNWTFRYIFPCNTWNSAGVSYMNNSIANLNLQEKKKKVGLQVSKVFAVINGL